MAGACISIRCVSARADRACGVSWRRDQGTIERGRRGARSGRGGRKRWRRRLQKGRESEMQRARRGRGLKLRASR
eukprot:1391179-Rhodomonas_salina.2